MVNEDTQTWVQTPPDSSGKKLDTRYFTTTGGTTVHREVMHIGGTSIYPGAIATVTNSRLDINALIPGVPRTPTTRGSSVAQVDHSAVIASNASFSVSVPAVLRLPSTRGSTIVQADHSLVIGTNASFSVSVPGLVRLGTTRGSAVVQADHSALISVSAASFTVGAQAKSYAGVWPVAQSTGVYNPYTQDTLGRQVVLLNTTPGRSESTVVAISSANAVSIFAAVPGVRHVITDLTAVNTGSTSAYVLFVNGQTGAGFNGGRNLAYMRSLPNTGATFSGETDRDFLTPIFTNLGATFAASLSRTVLSVRINASGYQSTV